MRSLLWVLLESHSSRVPRRLVPRRRRGGTAPKTDAARADAPADEAELAVAEAEMEVEYETETETLVNAEAELVVAAAALLDDELPVDDDVAVVEVARGRTGKNRCVEAA